MTVFLQVFVGGLLVPSQGLWMAGAAVLIIALPRYLLARTPAAGGSARLAVQLRECVGAPVLFNR